MIIIQINPMYSPIIIIIIIPSHLPFVPEQRKKKLKIRIYRKRMRNRREFDFPLYLLKTKKKSHCNDATCRMSRKCCVFNEWYCICFTKRFLFCFQIFLFHRYNFHKLPLAIRYMYVFI